MAVNPDAQRVNVSLSPRSARDLSELVELLEVTNKTELINRAVQAYAEIQREQHAKRKFYIREENGKTLEGIRFF